MDGDGDGRANRKIDDGERARGTIASSRCGEIRSCQCHRAAEEEASLEKLTVDRPFLPRLSLSKCFQAAFGSKPSPTTHRAANKQMASCRRPLGDRKKSWLGQPPGSHLAYFCLAKTALGPSCSVPPQAGRPFLLASISVWGFVSVCLRSDRDNPNTSASSCD